MKQTALQIGLPFVSDHTLLLRINRSLKRNGQKLHKTRGAAAKFQLGEYYIGDDGRGILVRHHVDIHALAEEVKDFFNLLALGMHLESEVSS